ncbi:hypothetical protein Tco_0357847, partial [Tanacetum coccineum]
FGGDSFSGFDRKQLFLANPLGGVVGGFGSALGGGSTVVDGSFGGGAFLVEGVMVVYVFLCERDECGTVVEEGSNFTES